MPLERLQKIMAAAGFSSRRACEEVIRQGRVRVNGVVAELGSSADATKDEIRIDGTRLRPPPSGRTFAIHKPRGVVSSLAPQGPRKTVRECLPMPGRFYPVGRLDVESDGLMLLTNDGALAERVTHPRYQVEKEYRVLLAVHPSREQLETWQRGVVLADGFRTGKCRVFIERSQGKGVWVHVVMNEGHKHEIREIAGRIGLPIVTLTRIRIGGVMLGNLRSGEWRELTEAELTSLREGNALSRFLSNGPISSEQQGKPYRKPRTASSGSMNRPPRREGSSEDRRSRAPERSATARPSREKSRDDHKPRSSTRGSPDRPPRRESPGNDRKPRGTARSSTDRPARRENPGDTRKPRESSRGSTGRTSHHTGHRNDRNSSRTK